MWSSLLLYVLIFVNVQINLCEETVNVEVDEEGKQKEPKLKNPNSLEVIFENQSGKKVELYWDDNVNGVLQSELSHTSQITINTFIGHKFYFTPSGSGGKKEKVLYQVIMEQHTGLITLYNERIMKERGQEFERKKNQFMREYFQNTGRKWKNYYPRNPITHFMYNFTHIGQQIVVKTGNGQFTQCKEDIIDTVKQDIQQQIFQCQEDDKESKKNKSIANFHRAETDDINVIYYNGTYLCQNKNDQDVEQVTINVLCASPKVAYFDNFLSEEECQHIQLIGTLLGLKRSTVSEEALETEDRTSSTVWIERKNSPIIDDIVKRIANVIKIDENKLYLNQSSESLQLVHYESGQLYKAHVDYGTDRPHNRYLTFLMYLNNVNGGGYTSFPKAPNECKNENGYMGVEPKQGRVAFFYDLLPDGNVDELTQHYAEPPSKGNEKWMTNLWIWDAVFTR